MCPRHDYLRDWNGSITIEHEPAGRRVLCLRGEIDTAVVADFYGVYGGVSLVVDEIDAGGVTFISSTGVAVLLRCATESASAGRHPSLRASSPQVDRLLRLADLDGLFSRPERLPDEPGA